MTTWQSFHQQQVTHNHDDCGDNWFAWLSHQSLFSVTGADAASFLHKQFSNEVERLPLAQLRRAAYCNAKGRMLASLLYWRDDSGIYLQFHHSLAASLIKRLKMFVLRDKVEFQALPEEQVLLGLSGPAVAQALSDWYPELPAENQVISNAAGSLMRLADSAGAPRYQWLTHSELLQTAWAKLIQHLRYAPSSRWELSDIQAGIAEVTATTQEHYVPQMINFELIGGVNFKKGCYPGQEVVARSQYLGKLKRRMFIAQLERSDSAEFPAGSEVFNAQEPDQACGELVAIQPVDSRHSLCLLQIRLIDQESNQLHLAAADGPALSLVALPYEIADITA